MKTSIKACLFDHGDTLVGYPLRDPEGQLALLRRFFDDPPLRLPCPGVDAAELARRLNREAADGTVWPFRERVRNPSFFGPELAEEAAMSLEQTLCERVFRGAELFEDTLDALSRLRRAGFRLGIVSNTPWGTDPALWRREVARHGLAELCDAVVFCGDVGFRKPHPAGLRTCLARLGVKPEQALFVGDNLDADIPAARNAGCRPVWFNRSGAVGPTHACASVPCLSRLAELLET